MSMLSINVFSLLLKSTVFCSLDHSHVFIIHRTTLTDM